MILYIRIKHRLHDFFRQGFSARQIDDVYIATVYAVSKQQYLKIIGLHIFVQSGFRDVYTAIGFDVDAQMPAHAP